MSTQESKSNTGPVFTVIYFVDVDPKDIPSERDFPEPLFSGADLIHAHTRAQAIQDGDLIDVTTQAQGAGFRSPVACTAGLYGQLVGDGPNAALRLEALLRTAYVTACESVEAWENAGMGREPDRARFSLRSNHVDGLPDDGEQVDAYLTASGGDNGETVITIMLDYED